MSSNTTKKTFEIESYFAKEYASKWDNLLIYKNGFLDDFSKNESIKSFLKNPKGIKSDDNSSQSFVKEFEKTLLKTKKYEFKTIGLVNTIQEERPFSFDFKVKAQVDFLNKDKRISNNTFVYKIHPDKKAQITLNNTDKLLIAENFSQIDFSKPSTSLGSFVSIVEEEIKDTYDNDKTTKGELEQYNNKDFKNFYDNIKKLFNTENDDDFSSTLGFCVKSLTVEDISDLKEANRRNLINLFPKSFDQISNYVINNTDINNTDVSYLREKIKRSLFTTYYFSCFKNNTDDTYAKKNFSSNLTLNVLQSNSNENKTHIKLTSSNKKELYEIKPISKEFLIEKLKKVKNRFALTGKPKLESLNLLENIIEDKKDNKPNIDFITDIEYTSEKIFFKVEYALLNFYDPLLNPGSALDNEYRKYHFFDPVICLETINGPTVLLDVEEETTSRGITYLELISNNKILKDLDTGGAIASQRGYSPNHLIATRYEKLYSISVEKIFKNVTIKNNKELFSLKSKYENKYYFIRPKQFLVSTKENNLVIEKNISSNKESKESFYSFVKDKIDFESLELKDYLFIRSDNVEKAIKTNPIKSTLTEQNRPTPKKSSLNGQKEKVLHIADNIKTEFQRKSEKQKNNVIESSFVENLKDTGTELEKINNINIINNWFELNGVSEENPRGTAIKSKNKKIEINFFDAYQARRGNVQPKLLKIIESAYDLTAKKYPRLDGVHITSTSSCPVELWVEAADLINTYHTQKNKLIEKLNNLGFYNVNKKQNTDEYSKNIYNIIRRSSENVQDLNHNLGFAVDLYLTINDPNSKKPRRICIYEPKEDLEFKIFKYFIEMCFKLGANSIGAGMYYMDYPHYETYNKKNGNDGKYKKGLNHNGKIIVDDNLIPIRVKGSKYNAIHVDIVGYNDEIKNLKEIADTGNLKAKRIAEYISKFKNTYLTKSKKNKKHINKLGQDLRIDERMKLAPNQVTNLDPKKTNLFKFITNEEDLKNASVENSKIGALKNILSRKNYSKNDRMMWGESGSKTSADTWLWRAADKARPTTERFSKAFDNNEITVDNFKESSVIQFIKELERKKKKDFITDDEKEVDTTISGNSELFNFIVKESELKKDNNK